ncbi:MAG: hypothetical protein MUF34_38005 [Polyangiaceae bacterium]|nr:hypothetical protein [Polyangiaceae bacterium]
MCRTVSTAGAFASDTGRAFDSAASFSRAVTRPARCSHQAFACEAWRAAPNAASAQAPAADLASSAASSATFARPVDHAAQRKAQNASPTHSTTGTPSYMPAILVSLSV